MRCRAERCAVVSLESSAMCYQRELAERPVLEFVAKGFYIDSEMLSDQSTCAVVVIRSVLAAIRRAATMGHDLPW